MGCIRLFLEILATTKAKTKKIAALFGRVFGL
jgi:hypothetical protein